MENFFKGKTTSFLAFELFLNIIITNKMYLTCTLYFYFFTHNLVISTYFCILSLKFGQNIAECIIILGQLKMKNLYIFLLNTLYYKQFRISPSALPSFDLFPLFFIISIYQFCIMTVYGNVVHTKSPPQCGPRFRFTFP